MVLGMILSVAVVIIAVTIFPLRIYSISVVDDVKLSNFSFVHHRDSRNFGKHGNQQTFEECTTVGNIKGTCMRRLECIKNGGIASGYCGTYGVCCELNLACNAVSKLKRTTIRSPTPLPTKCTYHFQAYSHNVCQMKIEFDMVLAQPTIPDNTQSVQAVTCVTDIFQVGDIKICGTNTNQHIYVPFDVASGTSDVSLTFTLASRNQNPSVSGHWSMVVTQLECPTVQRRSENGLGFLHQYKLKDLKDFLRPPVYDIDRIAPAGCLQYFTESKGTFESFNYNGGRGPYIGNMRYGICFRRTSTDTGVQLTAISFEIGAYSSNNQYLDEDCHTITETEGRSNDYLLVPESILALTPPLFGTRYCGTSLQNADLFHAPPGPFAIFFNSDNMYTTTVPEKGFRIQYSIQ